MSPDENRVHIVLADTHPIFRDGLRRLLEAELDLQVVGEASDVSDGIKLARQVKTDILIIDPAMAGPPELRALHELSQGTGSDGVRVILLIDAAAKQQIVQALHLGVRGVS